MIRPVQVSASYRASVAMAALAMLAVPLIYAGFVGLVAGAVVLWAYLGLALAGHLLGLMIYVAILAAGVTVLLFLAKAFFRRPRMREPATVIALADHPALAELIGRVCSATGAPQPAEVAVDLSLNASASLLHPFRGLFNNRYRLSLGLPLVAISDRQHMAHLVAHEVGHFSQRGAMRVCQLIHLSQYYLNRLVEDRDKWDIWLASQSSGTAYVVRLFAWAAATGIWLSRRTLRLLLQGSLLVNARMSREMEFHADLYAIRVAGSAAFAASAETFAAGAAAYGRAMQMVERAAAEGRQTDDFAALLAACFGLLTAEERRELTRQRRYTTGLGTDSHPDDADRLERSGRENDAGVLAEQGAAEELFAGFEALCRAETGRMYTEAPKEVVPWAALLAEDQRRDGQDGARIQFFGAVYDGPVWLRIGEAREEDDRPWVAAIAAGDEARSNTFGYFQEIVTGYSRWVVDTVVLRRLDAGLPVDWMRLELEPCDAAAARGRMFAREKEYWAKVDSFHRAVAPIVARLLAAFARRDRLAPERQKLFERLLGEMRGMEAADEPTTQLALDLAVLGDLGSMIDEYLHSESFLVNIQAEFEGAVRNARTLEAALTAETLAYARPQPMDPESGVGGFLNTYGGTLGRLRDRRLRSMGQLAELALEVEASRGLEAG
jgi:Zn-dependent protease with chaperone function